MKQHKINFFESPHPHSFNRNTTLTQPSHTHIWLNPSISSSISMKSHSSTLRSKPHLNPTMSLLYSTTFKLLPNRLSSKREKKTCSKIMNLFQTKSLTMLLHRLSTKKQSSVRRSQNNCSYHSLLKNLFTGITTTWTIIQQSGKKSTLAPAPPSVILDYVKEG